MATNIETVTQSFIKEIQTKGIVHTFEWIQGWMNNVAAAALEDEASSHEGDMPNKELAREARSLFLEEIVSSGAESITNSSTSMGHNYMKQARVAEASRKLNRQGARTSINMRWDALHERISAAKAAEKAAAEQASGVEPIAELVSSVEVKIKKLKNGEKT